MAVADQGIENFSYARCMNSRDRCTTLQLELIPHCALKRIVERVGLVLNILTPRKKRKKFRESVLQICSSQKLTIISRLSQGHDGCSGPSLRTPGPTPSLLSALQLFQCQLREGDLLCYRASSLWSQVWNSGFPSSGPIAFH